MSANQPEPSLHGQNDSNDWLDKFFDDKIATNEPYLNKGWSNAKEELREIIQADKEAAVRAEREWALDNANKMASGVWNPELGVIAAEQRVKQIIHPQAGEGEGK